MTWVDHRPTLGATNGAGPAQPQTPGGPIMTWVEHRPTLSTTEGVGPAQPPNSPESTGKSVRAHFATPKRMAALGGEMVKIS